MGSQGTMKAVEGDCSTCWLVHCQPGNVTCAVPWPETHMTCWTSLQGGVSSGARRRLCPKALGAPGLGAAAELLGRSGLCSLSLLEQELQDVLFSAHTKA